MNKLSCFLVIAVFSCAFSRSAAKRCVPMLSLVFSSLVPGAFSVCSLVLSVGCALVLSSVSVHSSCVSLGLPSVTPRLLSYSAFLYVDFVLFP